MVKYQSSQKGMCIMEMDEMENLSILPQADEELLIQALPEETKPVLTDNSFDQRFVTPDARQRDIQFHQRFMAGDKEAFAELWACYEQLVIKNCKLLLRNQDDAIDAKDAIFLKAFVSFDGFDPSMSFVPWIKRITRNHCLNILSRNARHPMICASEGRDEDGNMSADAEAFMNAPDLSIHSPFEQAAAHELAGNIEKCMNKLSESHREIITLQHFEGYSYDEIAKALRVPIGTVMSRLFNARQKFQEHYIKLAGHPFAL